MTELTVAELDRKLGYKMVLERIMTDAELLLDYCAIEGISLSKAYLRLDSRIKELDAELHLHQKQEGVDTKNGKS